MNRMFNAVILAAAVAGILGAVLAWGFATDAQRHQFLSFCWLKSCEGGVETPEAQHASVETTPASARSMVASMPAPAAATPGNSPAPVSPDEVCRQFTSTTYCVSSVLAPQGENSYGPEQLFDSDPNTAWVPDTLKSANGLGEWILLRFAHPRSVGAIVIANGYQKTDRDVYDKNDRPHEIDIILSNGRTQQAVLEDRTGVQRIALSGADDIDWVQVTIRSVYPGTKYQDVGISDIGAE